MPQAPVGVLLVQHASHSHSSLEHVHSPGLSGARDQTRPSQAVRQIAGKILLRVFFGQRARVPMADWTVNFWVIPDRSEFLSRPSDCTVSPLLI